MCVLVKFTQFTHSVITLLTVQTQVIALYAFMDPVDHITMGLPCVHLSYDLMRSSFIIPRSLYTANAFPNTAMKIVVNDILENDEYLHTQHSHLGAYAHTEGETATGP